jgi:hypothetical protein
VGSEAARSGSARRRRRPAADRLPRRVTDRVEDAAAWVLIAAALLLAVLAGCVGAAVHADGLQRSATETAQRRQVAAEVLAEAPPDLLAEVRTGITPGTLPEAVPPAGRYRTALARWTAPDGRPVTGRIPVAAATPAGRAGMAGRLPTVVPGRQLLIWVDAAGGPTRPPSTPTQAVQAGVVAAVTLLLLGLIALGAAWLGVRALVTRSNDRRWERDWARVGPRWSGRVH